METAAAPVTIGTSQFRFSAGSVISRSFSVWAENAVSFSVVFLVVHAPTLVLSWIAGPGPRAGTTPPLLYGILSVVNAVGNYFLTFVAAGALTYGVLQSLAGHRPGVGQLLGFGLRKLWPVFVVAVDAGVRIFLWSLLLFIPGFVAMCRFFVAVPVRVAEPSLRSHQAVARSSELTKGHRWAIFVVFLVFWMLGAGAMAVVGVLGPGLGVLPFPVTAFIIWFVGAIASSFWACAAGVAYHDLRIEKDGIDTGALAAVFE